MDRQKIIELAKRFPAKELETGNIRTSIARLSYPSLFEKSKPNGNVKEEKYKCTLLFPKGMSLTLLEEAAKHTAIEEFGSKWSTMGIRMPLLKQGEKAHKDGYEDGAFYITVKSDQRPGIVNVQGKIITNPAEVYAGCWVIATINPFSYTSPGKGVSFGLQNVIKIADDESFGAAPADPSDEFGDIFDASGDADSMFGEDADGSDDTSLEDVF